MTITNIRQYEAASEEERAVWLGKRLGFAKEETHAGQIEIHWKPDLSPVAVYGRERDFAKWLASPDGSAAIRAALQRTGWMWGVHNTKRGLICYRIHRPFNNENPDPKWCHYEHEAATEAEAVQHAAARALIAEIQQKFGSLPEENV